MTKTVRSNAEIISSSGVVFVSASSRWIGLPLTNSFLLEYSWVPEYFNTIIIMQRLDWHCHTKSVSGALYKAILYHGQSAGKEMAIQAANDKKWQWVSVPGAVRVRTLNES